METRKVYIFEPADKFFITEEDRLEDWTTASLRENETFIPVLPEKDGFYRIFNTEKSIWEYRESLLYGIDDNGFYTGRVSMPCGSKEIAVELVNVEPPVNMVRPHWNGAGWADLSEPDDIYVPVFDKQRGVYIEGATTEMIKGFIDSETGYLIKKWCTDQSKNEEYYINRGILYGKDDPEYSIYDTTKSSIISVQRQKKQDQGVL